MFGDGDIEFENVNRVRELAGHALGAQAVVLAPDVAEVFPTSESVNTFLRNVIAAVPRPGRRSTVRRRSHPRKRGLTKG